MYRDFEYRWLNELDYSELCIWWKWFRFPAPPQAMLPDNGRCGMMVSKNGVNICAGFLYMTNSGLALVEYVVSNPQYREDDRKDAIDLLLKLIETQAKQEGYLGLFSTVRNQNLINSMESNGWKVGSKTKEMIKIIE